MVNGEASVDFFKERIKAYLDNRIETDPLFVPIYAKENKSLDECVQFIFNQVKNSGRIGFENEEIYSLAVHYYDEDDIDVGSPVSCMVISDVRVELSEEEVKQAKEEAYDKLVQKQLNSLSKGKKAPTMTVIKGGAEQQTLF